MEECNSILNILTIYSNIKKYKFPDFTNTSINILVTFLPTCSI